MNNIIEDAREKKKELWIATQDMRKAYDSIGLGSLELALQRIDIPQNIIKWIIQLYKNRLMKVIAPYGRTDALIAADGID